MSLDFTKPDLQELKPRITVIGVGGAGGNAVNNMITTGLMGVDFVVANTDAQALTGSSAENRLQLGLRITQGLGAGSRPEIGRAAAEETLEQIETALEGAHMCFITAGMGGGTGTGAAPIVAKAARERGILTVAVVTKPFDFEGPRRMRLADEGIAELHKHVDTLIIIPNQNLFRVADRNTTFKDAFALADNVLHSGVRSITDLMVMPGLINLDFADVRTVMSEMGKAMMGTGESDGEHRALDAAERAINNPLLDEVSLRGAKGIIINVTGGYDLTLFEVDEAANHIRSMVDPDANIIVGAAFNEHLEGKMRVSVVATGIEAIATARAQAPATQKPASTFGTVAGAFHTTDTTRHTQPEHHTSLTAPAVVLPESPAHQSHTHDDALNLTNPLQDAPISVVPTFDIMQPMANPLSATTVPTPAQLPMVNDSVVAFPSPPLVETAERPYVPTPDIIAAPKNPSPLPEPVRTASLFERMTSGFRAGNNGTSAQPGVQHSAAELGGASRTERPNGQTTEDPFAIPTFLRRQSN